MSNTEELGIRLNAAGVPETTNGINLAAQATENLGKKADGARPALDRHTQGVERAGVSAKQTAAAWRMLPAQLSDITTQLAAGTPVWMVAIQQGPQIKDAFGGVGPMFKELAGALTLGRVAIGATAVAVGTLLLAHEQGQREAQGYSRALIMTGNAAGTTGDQMADMAAKVSQAVGTQGKAAEAITALAGTGEVARANLQAFTDTAVRMDRELGTPIEDTARRFQDLGRAPLEASLRLNRGVNYLTGAIYDQIRALMAEGKVVEAGAVAQRAYSDAMNGRAKQVQENLGWLEKSWRAVAGVAKFAWDRMLDVGRDETLDSKLAKAQRDLERMKRFDDRRGVTSAEQARRDEKQAEIDALLEQRRLADSSAQRQAEQTSGRQKELRDRDRANIEAGLAVDLARAGSAAAQREALAERDLAVARASGNSRESALRAQTATLEDLHTRDGVSLADYYQRRAQLERDGLAVEIGNVDAEIRAAQRQAAARAELLDQQISAESKRRDGVVELPAERAQSEARLLELTGQKQALQVQTEMRLIELRSQRGRLTQEQTAAETAAERALRLASADAAERYLDDVERRRQALAQLADQQRQSNAQAAVDLIADPYTRAAAKARLDIEQLNRFYAEQLSGLRARLPGLETADPDQAAAVREQILQAEAAKNAAIVLRNKQLTEELKPEWKRQLDAWQDHMRLMRESFDEFQSGWLDAGRNAWQDYLRTGKLSIDSLGAFMRQQFGDVIFKQLVAPTFSKIGEGVAGFFGMGGGGAQGAVSATGIAAETTARSLNTATVTANSTAMGNLALTASYAASALAQVAASGGNSTAGLIGSLLSAWAGGGSGLTAVDAGGYGMTPADGSVALPTAGGRAAGGSTRRGSLYEVNERGPELLSVNNRTYLMMGGKDGYVIPNGQGSRRSGDDGRGGMQITYAPQISIDSRSDRADVEQMVARAVRSGQVELLDMMQRRQA